MFNLGLTYLYWIIKYYEINYLWMFQINLSLTTGPSTGCYKCKSIDFSSLQLSYLDKLSIWGLLFLFLFFVEIYMTQIKAQAEEELIYGPAYQGFVWGIGCSESYNMRRQTLPTTQSWAVDSFTWRLTRGSSPRTVFPAWNVELMVIYLHKQCLPQNLGRWIVGTFPTS